MSGVISYNARMTVKRDKVVQAVAGAISRDGLIEPGSHVLAAVSGGADSVALAAVLRELSQGRRGGFRLTLAHLDHGLRATSRRDADSVRQLAVQWELPLVSRRVDVKGLARRRNVGIEEAARIARYDFLRRAAIEVGADRVALGHHQDDQAETVLLNLLRGGDIRGLAGMPVRRAIISGSEIEIIRPLLSLTRHELRAFLERRKIGWVEDETNLSTVPLRNRIRLELLPLLEREYASGISRRLAALAERMSCLAAHVQSQADAIWPQLLRKADSPASPAAPAVAVELDRVQLVAAGRAVAVRLICRAIEHLGIGLGAITAEHLDAAWDVAASVRGGRRLNLPGGLQLHREKDVIRIESSAAAAGGR